MFYSRLITFKSNTSTLTSTFNPPLQLPKNSVIGVSLLSFNSYNSIPNVTKRNNKFYFGGKFVTMPRGNYEVHEIAEWVKKYASAAISITTNLNTLKCEIVSDVYIDFTKSDSFGDLLGFSKRVLLPEFHNVSDEIVQISNVKSITVECSIATGSYVNGKPCHSIYEFCPKVPSGYHIIEEPEALYLPIIGLTSLDEITLRVVDQENQLVDFRGELITIVLHIKSF